MRRNAKRVADLSDQLISEITQVINTRSIQEVEFKRPFTIQLDVQSTTGDYWDVEEGLCRRITGEGMVIVQSDLTGDEQEVKLDELKVIELAFILDELEEENYKQY
jgi:predicted secreted protein